jgi:hypothetical protein
VTIVTVGRASRTHPPHCYQRTRERERDDVYVNPTSTATVRTTIAANATTKAINTYAGSRSLPRSSFSRNSAWSPWVALGWVSGGLKVLSGLVSQRSGMDRLLPSEVEVDLVVRQRKHRG